jgi:hypothetical protein
LTCSLARLPQVLNPAQAHLKELPLPARLVPAHMAPGRLRSRGAGGSGAALEDPKPVWRVGDKVLQMENDADNVGGRRPRYMALFLFLGLPPLASAARWPGQPPAMRRRGPGRLPLQPALHLGWAGS